MYNKKPNNTYKCKQYTYQHLIINKEFVVFWRICSNAYIDVLLYKKTIGDD